MQPVLDGIRVIDFGRYIAGPFCAALLADYGADVIRVEKRDGSEDRYVVPVAENGDGALFMQMNRNKRSLTLDPAHVDGREIVRRLVATADVVVVNLPQRTLEHLGLDYPTLRAIKPDIILTSVSAYGTSGPYRDRVGFDGIGQAMSASIHMTGEPDQPYRTMTAFVDFTTALSCAYGTALALLERARTGQGCVVEASLLRSALNLTNSLIIEQHALGLDRTATANRGQTGAPSDLYRTADGWILMQVAGAPLFARVAKLIEAEEWLTDPRFATDQSRGDHGALISERVGRWCAARSTTEVLAELSRARIPCGPVYAPRQVLDDPHVRETELYAPVAYPGLAKPATIARTPVTLGGAERHFARAPLLGEHTDAILTELGYDAAAIERLAAAGAI